MEEHNGTTPSAATLAAAAALFLGAGAFVLAVGFGWLGPWFQDASSLVRLVSVAEGLFLIAFGMLPLASLVAAGRAALGPRVHSESA